MRPEPVIETDFTAVRKTRHGWIAHNKNDQTIGLSLAEYGEWAELELSGGMLHLLRPGDIVVDAGAHIGTHTIAFAKAVGSKGHVLAFEPQLWAHYYLGCNVALNSLDNVTALRLCVGESAGEMLVPMLDQRARQNFGALPVGSDGAKTGVVTIDSYNLPGCRLIKIDVEGAEMSVHRGAECTIDKHKPVIFCEAKTPEIVGELWQFLGGKDYKLLWFAAPFFSENNFYGSTVEHNAGGGDVSIIAVNHGVHIDGLIDVIGPNDTWELARERWLASQTT